MPCWFINRLIACRQHGYPVSESRYATTEAYLSEWAGTPPCPDSSFEHPVEEVRPAPWPSTHFPLSTPCRCGHEWGRHNSYAACCAAGCDCRDFTLVEGNPPPEPTSEPAPAPEPAPANSLRALANTFGIRDIPIAGYTWRVYFSSGHVRCLGCHGLLINGRHHLALRGRRAFYACSVGCATALAATDLAEPDVIIPEGR